MAARHTGLVKFFNTQKGYGFIVAGENAEQGGADAPQPGQEYFVHFSAVAGDGFKSLAPGEEVEFELDTNQTTGKLCAVNVTGPGGASVQGAPAQQMNKGGGKGGKGGFKGGAGFQMGGFPDGGKGFAPKGGKGEGGKGKGGKGKGGGYKGKGKAGFEGGYDPYVYNFDGWYGYGGGFGGGYPGYAVGGYGGYGGGGGYGGAPYPGMGGYPAGYPSGYGY